MSGGTRSYEMARRWAAAGHDVQMIAAQPNESDGNAGWTEETMAGFTLHRLSVPYANVMSYRRRIKAFYTFARAAGRKAREVGGDIVFATSTPLTIAIPGVSASKKLGIPMVFEVRDLWPEIPIAIGAIKNPVLKWAAKKLELYAYNNSKHVVALSPGMADGVANTGYKRENITVAPNSSDLELFDQTSESGKTFLAANPHFEGKPLIVYTGAFGKMNNVPYLAEIAAQARTLDPNMTFVVAGDGYEFEKVKKLATELKVLNENFFLIGRVKKTEIPPILSAATVATSVFTDLPEHHANSANKFFDGLASAKPMMINYEGWQANLIREHQFGLVVPAADPAEAARLLKEYISDDERLLQAGAASLNLAKNMFNRDAIAALVLTVLEQVANE